MTGYDLDSKIMQTVSPFWDYLSSCFFEAAMQPGMALGDKWAVLVKEGEPCVYAWRRPGVGGGSKPGGGVV